MGTDERINRIAPALSEEADPDKTCSFTADDGETQLSRTTAEMNASRNRPEISYHYQKTQGVSLRYTDHMIDESEVKDDVGFQDRVNNKKASPLKSWMPAIAIVVAASCVILLACLFLNSQKDRKTYSTPETIEETVKE